MIKGIKIGIFFISFLFMGVFCREEGHREPENTDHSHVHDERVGNIHKEGDHEEHDHDAHAGCEDHGEERRHDAENGRDGHVHGETAGVDLEAMKKTIGLEYEIVKEENIETQLKIPGKLILPPDGKAVVSSFIEGRVKEVFVNVGAVVKKGDLLACVESPKIGLARAAYEKAKVKTVISRENFNRKKELEESKVISRGELLEAEMKYEEAAAELDFQKKELLLYGIKAEEIDHPDNRHTELSGSTFHLYAPLRGVISSRQAVLGEKVVPGAELFEIIQTDTLWVEGELFDQDLKKVEGAEELRITPLNIDGETVKGTIFHVSREVDSLKGTVTLYGKTVNEGGSLKPNMFVDVRVVTGVKKGVAVPVRAIVKQGEKSYVYTYRKGRLVLVPVSIGEKGLSRVEITEGVRAGDRVVSKGAFYLKAQDKMKNMDPHAGHNH